MISRIYIKPTRKDSRGDLYQKSFNNLDLTGKVTSVELVDSYTIDAKLSKTELANIAQALTNKRIESSSINTLPPSGNFSFICEIGFMPGVTDNVAHTTTEEIVDTIKRPFTPGEAVYTSRLFFIEGDVTESDVKKIAYSLHNQLIERFNIIKKSSIKNNVLTTVVPSVKLAKKVPVIEVALAVSDDELIKIGKEGIMDVDGTRRGPLALDLASMKIIQEYFGKLKRNPTDIELESLAQTWSEHCKHTIFANSIDDIKDGLYKTYIKGATNKIRKEKGKVDFCISVFSDIAEGIVFDKD